MPAPPPPQPSRREERQLTTRSLRQQSQEQSRVSDNVPVEKQRDGRERRGGGDVEQRTKKLRSK